MLPFVFKMSPVEVFAFLLGMHAVAALIAESKKAKIEVGNISPEEALKMFNGLLDRPPEVQKEMVKHIKFAS